MLTRRESLFTLAGLTGTFLVVGSLGLAGSALAQGSDGSPTSRTGIRARARAHQQRAKVKWESLTPEQQEHLQTIFKEEAVVVQKKWQGMTSEQQQEVIAKARAQGRRAQEKWKTLPE